MFLGIFHPHPAPEMRFEVEKRRSVLFSNFEVRDLWAPNAWNLTFNNSIDWSHQAKYLVKLDKSKWSRGPSPSEPVH